MKQTLFLAVMFSAAAFAADTPIVYKGDKGPFHTDTCTPTILTACVPCGEYVEGHQCTCAYCITSGKQIGQDLTRVYCQKAKKPGT